MINDDLEKIYKSIKNQAFSCSTTSFANTYLVPDLPGTETGIITAFFMLLLSTKPNVLATTIKQKSF